MQPPPGLSGQRYLYDVLLDDLPLWDADMVRRVLPAAQLAKRAAPGQREGASERRLHGLPARHLPPFPRLALQALDSLQRTEQNSEVLRWKKALDRCACNY